MSISIRNLVGGCTNLLEQMASFVHSVNLEDAKITKKHPGVITIYNNIQTMIKGVEQICQENDFSPAWFPIPSKFAYGWLHFLVTEKKDDDLPLESHLKTLALAYRLLLKARNEQKISSNRKKLDMHLTFYNTSSLFRARQQENDFFVTFHEGFIFAPSEVIESLVLVVAGNNSPTYTTKFRTYSLTKAFAENNQILKLLDKKDQKSAIGKHHDLEKIFERVNHAYFDNMFNQPRLEWSRTSSKRNLGTYHPDSNSVVFSKMLDNPKVPELVLEFVMYHELLHKQMGLKIVNGRSYSHTEKFRSAERQFLHYDEVEKMLKTLVRRR